MERRITLAACSSGLAKWMVAVRDSMNQEDRMGADILRLPDQPGSAMFGEREFVRLNWVLLWVRRMG